MRKILINFIFNRYFIFIVVLFISLFLFLKNPGWVSAVDCTDGGQVTMCFTSASCPTGCKCTGVTTWGAGACALDGTSGGSGTCGSARAPGCEGLCGEGQICRPSADGFRCVCKNYIANCNGGYTTECKQYCTPAGARDGTCYKRNGTKGTWCRVRTCTQSSPIAPTLVSPANGSTVSTSTVRLTWNPTSFGKSCNPSQVNTYSVFAGTLNNLTRVATLPASQTFFDYIIPGTISAGEKIYWDVVVSNNCDALDKSSALWYFINQGGITGNVYSDPGNTCSTATKWTLTNSLKIQTNTGLIANVTNGSYVLAAVPGTYSLSLTGMPAGYICSTGCAQSCPTAAGVVSPSSKNFFLTYSPGPWWQVKDGDVESNGDLNSAPPLPQPPNFFDLKGPGGFPGIPTYNGTLSGIDSTNVSETKWLAASSITNPKIYNYQFFINQVPTSILSTFNTIAAGDDVAADLTNPGATHDSNSDFYYWYKYDGNANGHQALTIPAVDIGDRKVIVFVDSADVNITGNIALNDGVGFFLLIVGQDAAGNGGSINVATSVGGGAANLEGLYIGDDSFADGTLKPGGDDVKLHVRGSVVAYRSVALQRDLGAADVTDPAELFEYAPDQIMLFPKALSVRKINWKEIAP